MRKQKQISIEFDDGTKKQVIVQEISVSQIEALFPEMDLERFTSPETTFVEELKRVLDKVLIPTLSNLTLEDCRKMYPSDLERVINTIKEVNSSFFHLMEALNLVEWVKGLLKIWGTNLLSAVPSGQPVANSLKQDTQTQPNMDTPTS